MRHKFRKYIGKRGSALFMVLSVMTALIVTCLAMYFSVVSSRKTQYAIFNQQQSYQSALSLNESMLGGIIARTDDTEKSGFTALAEAVDKMALGDTITTKGNDYSSFDPAGSKGDEDQVGAYMAEITYLSDADEGRLYDFAVTTMVNGTESTVHQYVVIPNGGRTVSGGRPSLPLFVGSGLIPTGSAQNAGYVYADIFYDSEYTYFMPYGDQSDVNGGNKELKIMGDVYTAGSLVVNYNVTDADGASHLENSVRPKPHNWYIRKDLIMTNDASTVNFRSDISGYENTVSRVVVGGDCIFKSDARGFNNCEIYVYGDLIIEPGAQIGNNVKIYVAGTKDGTASGTGISVVEGRGSWPDGTYDQYIKDIDANTLSITYYDWNSEYESIPGIENEETANFVKTPGTPAAQFVWSPTNQGCTITGVSGFGGTTGGNFDYSSSESYKLVIDTGDDPNNVFTIRLQGYLDGGKTFSWCPNYGDYATWVVVRGKGSVVFEVPDGVTYENRSYKTNVMHENWMSNGAFGSQSQRDQIKNLVTGGWVHYECNDNCCVNPLNEISGETCDCGKQMYLLKCTDHNLERKVCLECDYVKYREDSSGNKVSYGTCECRVNDKGSNTPNTNIFLVMCGQNSKIQFTPPAQYMQVNGINESFSAFWGYIYAPYAPLDYSARMATGDKAVFVGGIVVGSFNLFGRNSYMPAYPNRLPNEIMSAKCREHPLPTIDGMPWKESLTPSVTA